MDVRRRLTNDRCAALNEWRRALLKWMYDPALRLTALSLYARRLVAQKLSKISALVAGEPSEQMVNCFGALRNESA